MKKLIPWIQKSNASAIKPPLRQFCVVAIGLKKRLLYKADNCGILRQFVLYQEVWIKMGIFKGHLFFYLIYISKGRGCCQNDPSISESLWKKDSLITHILFELWLIMILSPVATFGHHPLKLRCIFHSTRLYISYCFLSKEVLLFCFRMFSILHIFSYNEEKPIFFQISKKFPLSFGPQVYSEL